MIQVSTSGNKCKVFLIAIFLQDLSDKISVIEQSIPNCHEMNVALPSIEALIEKGVDELKIFTKRLEPR